MVDIAAQLSLTPSGPAIDPAAILGAETADSQAFGNILAGQVVGALGANSDTGAPAAPLPPFPVPAGNRQPGGKILPGAAQILPDAAPLGLEAPAAQVLSSQILPNIAAIPPLQLVTTAPLPKLLPQAGTATAGTETPESKQAETSPVHGLIKMLTAALKGQRPAADQAAEDAPAAAETAEPETADTPKPATPVVAPALAVFPFALPILTTPTVATPQAAASEAPRATAGGAAPILIPAAREQADAALRAQIQPALAQFLAQPIQALTQAQAAGTASTQAPAVPVLTVTATPGDTSAPVVTLVSAPALPVGQTVAARIKVAAPQGKDSPVAVQPQFADRDVAAETPVAASRAAPAVRAVLAERATTDLAATPITADSPLPLAAAASGPVTPAPTTGAPVVEMPRHDFAALVDRLVEARNASVSQSTHASLTHAEFGQVSLHFQQDGGDLKVGMSSADPDFARAAQAAQAVMPAERQNFTADSNSRGQSGSSQSQSQTANSSSQSHHEAAGHGAERSDQQNRNSQGRNSRGGNTSSNPSPRWADRDQSQTRGGIFA